MNILLVALLTSVALLVVFTGCKNKADEEDETPIATSEVGTPTPERIIEPDELTAEDLLLAANLSGLEQGSQAVDEEDNGVRVSISGLHTLRLGQTWPFTIRVTNEWERASSTQESGELLISGPIEIERDSGGDAIDGTYTLGPMTWNIDNFWVTCRDIGNATISFHSAGTSEVSTFDSYSVTIDYQIECIADDGQGMSFLDQTARALGFSPDSLEWVTYGEHNVNLFINQIEPVKVQVNDSAEVYSYFDAWGTVYNGVHRFHDARLEMLGGGPITIESPPSRQSDLFILPGSEDEFVLWGFRSATITCIDAGDAVYSSKLTRIPDGSFEEPLTLTVSGLIDCVGEPEPPIFSTVYTMDGRPYLQAQFTVEDPHDGCVFTHAHSDVTVYPFREWLFRGTTENIQTTGDAPLTDPDSEKCGFGPMSNISGSRITEPSSIMVPVAEMMDFCGRSEIYRIRPNSEREKINLDNLSELCNNLGAN